MLKARAALGRAALVAATAACSSSASTAGQQEKPPVSVGQAAGIGALLGVALGRDPIVGAVQGAALGAAGGLITNAVIEGQERSDRIQAEQQRQQQQAQEVQQDSAQAGQDLEREIEEAIGTDNYEGYKALRGCNHARASALAKAAATSSDEDHRITSIWLEAMIAVDQRNQEGANQFFQRIVGEDPDIDTLQQASLETDKVILDMRRERRDLGLSCR